MKRKYLGFSTFQLLLLFAIAATLLRMLIPERLPVGTPAQVSIATNAAQMSFQGRLEKVLTNSSGRPGQ